ncbi:MAG: hypothetical protein ACFB00_06230 [Parvularculaceae bacterium]
MFELRKAIACAAGLSAFACAANGVSDAADAGASPAARSSLRDYARTSSYSQCIDVDRTPNVSAVDDTTLLFRGRSAAYLNALAERCVGASGRGVRMDYAKDKAALCEGDPIKVVSRATGEEIRSCRLGPFEAALRLNARPETNARD